LFELLLFSSDPHVVTAAVDAGVNAIVIDWERRGKQERQALADTQIGHDTPRDLARVRRTTDAHIICRINGVNEATAEEVETAIGEGANELLVPMVRAASDVESVLTRVNGRCAVGMLVETIDAVRNVQSFSALPLSRVYVGLNDLAIERQAPNIFTAVADDTVEAVRASVGVPFGFGGLTLPHRGHPVPCHLLMGEMARLDCSFSFLRRSFHRDTSGQSLSDAIVQIRTGLAAAFTRPAASVATDRQALVDAIEGWTLPRAAAG
jgi:2-keto-3-deoxy-L-rhamnonate aldolase RhmA